MGGASWRPMPRRRGRPRGCALVHRAWVCYQSLTDLVTPSQILEEVLEEGGADLATPAVGRRAQLGHIGRENLDQVFTEFMALFPHQGTLAARVRGLMLPLEKVRVVVAGLHQGGVDGLRC